LIEESFANVAIDYFDSNHLDDWIEKLVARGVEFDQMPTE